MEQDTYHSHGLHCRSIRQWSDGQPGQELLHWRWGHLICLQAEKANVQFRDIGLKARPSP